MTCPRCTGLVINDVDIDTDDYEVHLIERCLNCGYRRYQDNTCTALEGQDA